jgi:hypothetical protein
VIKFFTKVDVRSRAAMVRFLTEHRRYYTMNSWNGSTSYVNCVKVTGLGLDRDLLDKALEMLEVEEASDGVHHVLEEFRYQVSEFLVCGKGRYL